MKNCDLHTHTTFSDGRSTTEEMILSAIDKGLQTIGISDHSYTPFDPDYCMSDQRYEEYIRTLDDLKKKYMNQIIVKKGIEFDYFSETIPQDLDYVIGSLHYVMIDGIHIPVDLSAQSFRDSIERYFHHDAYAFCELYYDTLCGLYEKTHCDIVGHFDLVTKFNEGNVLFDENSERYRWAWKKAASGLLERVQCFEINHGAQNKGLRSVPYPSIEIQDYIIQHGGKLIDTSDSHTTDTIGSF